VSAKDLTPRDVHLVGSVGLRNVQTVFNTAGRLLGPNLRRMPDGETGPRRNWIGWQWIVIRANPFLAQVTNQISPSAGAAKVDIAPGVAARDVDFGELGYSHAARASYQLFCRARASGEIPEHLRFQVSLPTPFGVASTYFAHESFEPLAQAYERAMLEEVAAICEAVPHEDLCIQWDVCMEMIMWDGQSTVFNPPYADVNAEVIKSIQRVCSKVPQAAECGIHLCYGDQRAKHFVEPRDASKMVELANAISDAVARPITYFHMPVPIERDDEAFFRPLAGLKVKDAGVYLGVVHADGEAKINARIAAARRFVRSFGIATECGIARSRREDLVMSLLKAHRLAS
jgi:hypothetical protein